MSLSVSCRPSSWNLCQWGLPFTESVQLGVLLLDGRESLSGPPAATAQVNLLDLGAFTQVGRAGGGDGQQDFLTNLRMPLRRLFLQRLDAGCQLGHQGLQLGNGLGGLIGLAHGASFCRGDNDQSGIRPYFFGGRRSRLAVRFSNARASLRRVSDGSTMSSTTPRAAETYGCIL